MKSFKLIFLIIFIIFVINKANSKTKSFVKKEDNNDDDDVDSKNNENTRQDSTTKAVESNTQNNLVKEKSPQNENPIKIEKVDGVNKIKEIKTEKPIENKILTKENVSSVKTVPAAVNQEIESKTPKKVNEEKPIKEFRRDDTINSNNTSSEVAPNSPSVYSNSTISNNTDNQPSIPNPNPSPIPNPNNNGAKVNVSPVFYPTAMTSSVEKVALTIPPQPCVTQRLIVDSPILAPQARILTPTTTIIQQPLIGASSTIIQQPIIGARNLRGNNLMPLTAVPVANRVTVSKSPINNSVSVSNQFSLNMVQNINLAPGIVTQPQVENSLPLATRLVTPIQAYPSARVINPMNPILLA